MTCSAQYPPFSSSPLVIFPPPPPFTTAVIFTCEIKEKAKSRKEGKEGVCVCVWWREKRKHLSSADIQETAAAAALLPFLPNPLLQHSFFFSIYSPPTSISHPPPFFCSDKNQFHSLLNLHFLFLSFFLFPPPPPSLFSSF